MTATAVNVATTRMLEFFMCVSPFKFRVLMLRASTPSLVLELVVHSNG